ncbi:hypothetical protein LIA77_06291 [Sarocladium implicatum]|nr:hypothetical protein LIA77_06291 [Sarocladium implicatum]
MSTPITAISIWQWMTKRIIWNGIQGTALVENGREPLRSPDEESNLSVSFDGQRSRPSQAGSEHALEMLPAQAETGRQRQHFWTNTHCWYAAIGGFAFEDYKDTILPFPHGLACMCLNPGAILHFAHEHPEVFPDISESALRDKSKANDVTKLIGADQDESAYIPSLLPLWGIHLLAWQGPFPSHKEKQFWYLGSFAAAPYILLMVVQWLVWSVMTEPAKARWKKAHPASSTPLMRVFMLFAPSFFVITRAFLTIEPYLALGYAPDRAFEVPRWLSYFPHIG